MTRQLLIDKLSRAIAEKEGFYVTAEQAKQRQIKYPTRALRNANPGNIRQWRDAQGRQYPTDGGYVDFVQWAADKLHTGDYEAISREALAEGWRVLRVLVSQYMDGRYTGGRPPTIMEMFSVYAPSGDGNDSAAYARFIAQRLGADIHDRLIDLIR